VMAHACHRSYGKKCKTVQAGLSKKVRPWDPVSKIIKVKRARAVTQAEVHSPSKHKVLSSKLQYHQKKKWPV
jgi:hypothetical protein